MLAAITIWHLVSPILFLISLAGTVISMFFSSVVADRQLYWIYSVFLAAINWYCAAYTFHERALTHIPLRNLLRM